MGDDIIEVQFRVYKEIKMDSGRIAGVKETAEVPDTGYAYVFRQLRPNESNDDGTRTRIFCTIDLSETQRTTLPELMRSHESHYFFVYSQIELTTSRVKRIRLDLHKYINHKKKNSSDECYLDPDRMDLTTRAIYIPIAHNMVDSRLFNASDRTFPLTIESSVNVDFNPDPQCNARIYLFDWFAYLKEMAEEYSHHVTDYQDKLNVEVELKEYYRGYDEDMDDAFGRIRQKPARGTLYEMTKAVVDFSKTIGKSNNLRSSMEYSYVDKSIARPYGDKRIYDYELFLDECKELDIEGQLEVCRKQATRIFHFITDSQRGIHHCLFDYAYGSESQIKEAMDTFGMSIQKNQCFLSEQDGDFFRNKFLFTVEDKDDCFESTDIDKMVEVTGDNNIFNAAIMKSLVSFTSVQSAHILDTVLQHAPYFMDNRPGIYAVMKYKTFQDLLQKDTSPIMFIDDQGMRHWYYSNNPGGTYSHSNAHRIWVQQNDATIKQMTVEYNTSFETVDDAALTIIEGPILETDPNKIRTLLKGGTQCAKEVLDGMAFIFDGLNVLEQVNVLIDLQNNDNKNGAILSLANSSLAVFNQPLTYLTNQIRVKMILDHAAKKGKKYAIKSVNKVATGQTSKIIGSAGIVLVAVEATFKAAQAGLNNDENAMAAFSVSAGFATAALVVSFIPGVNAAVWILMGVSACFSILGSVLTDDPMDLFLKYSFWGKEFHLAPRTIPNWWINGREGEEPEEGFYLNDMTYEEKKIDYGKIDIRELDSHRLIDMDRNLEVMKKAIQIPQNTVALKDEAVLQYAVTPYVKLSLESIDFEKLSFLKIKLLQSSEKRKMERLLGILPILAPSVNADGMEELFSQTWHIDEMGDGLCHINSFTYMSRKVSDYHEANAFELLFITNFNKLRRRHASSISERGSKAWRYNNSLSQQEFKDHFNIHPLFVEERRLKFDQNKVFEVTFSFRSEYNLMPVVYRLGVNRT